MLRAQSVGSVVTPAESTQERFQSILNELIASDNAYLVRASQLLTKVLIATAN